jgi:S-layer protein (TIGR01567 family)
MPSQSTKYKILIASPSDVVEEREAIPEVIKYWNTVNSDYYGVILEPVLWETHATPEMGDSPQAVINKQLVKKCDILVGIFWTRVGTPTEKAESGTVEEIEEFLKARKPVSLYFSSIPVDPDSIDIEQHKRLSDLKNKYKKKNLIVSYKSIDDFRAKLLMDITQKINSIHNVSIEVPKESRALEGDTKNSPSKKPIVLYPKLKPAQPTKIIQPSIAVSSEIGGGSGTPSNKNATIIIKPRIYDEKKLPPIGSAQLPSYKWDTQNFEGFWYDFKTGSNSEALEIGGPFGNSLLATIDHVTRTIPENMLVYLTIKQAKTLKVVESGITSVELLNTFGVDGKYNIVGWQGQPYVAVKGKANKLAKLIIEQGNATSEKKSLIVGETWDIGDGWALTAQSIDALAFPRQVWLVLSKDGIKIDDRVIGQGDLYVYVEKSFAGEADVPLFVTYVDSIFAGATSDMVQLRYTWAISTSVTEIKTGDKFGKMEVITASSENLILRNKDEPVNLIDTVDIMGNLKFIVADDPNFLRFYPVVLREQ